MLTRKRVSHREVRLTGKDNLHTQVARLKAGKIENAI
jgi:hypothetical protein